MVDLTINHFKKRAWIEVPKDSGTSSEIEYETLHFEEKDNNLHVSGEQIIQTLFLEDHYEGEENFDIDDYEEKYIKTEPTGNLIFRNWFKPRKIIRVVRHGWVTIKNRTPFTIDTSCYMIRQYGTKEEK